MPLGTTLAMDTLNRSCHDDLNPRHHHHHHSSRQRDTGTRMQLPEYYLLSARIVLNGEDLLHQCCWSSGRLEGEDDQLRSGCLDWESRTWLHGSCVKMLIYENNRFTSK